MTSAEIIGPCNALSSATDAEMMSLVSRIIPSFLSLSASSRPAPKNTPWFLKYSKPRLKELNSVSTADPGFLTASWKISLPSLNPSTMNVLTSLVLSIGVLGRLCLSIRSCSFFTLARNVGANFGSSLNLSSKKSWTCLSVIGNISRGGNTSISTNDI